MDQIRLYDQGDMVIGLSLIEDTVTMFSLLLPPAQSDAKARGGPAPGNAQGGSGKEGAGRRDLHKG